MNVHLTFDVEVWCPGWDRLDETFPASFERYVFGHSRDHGYALPRTLAALRQHRLTGVFFVEPLFSARFGAEHLKTITDLLLHAEQDVQLHLHPEWTDEIRPSLIVDSHRKRQHLHGYTLAEQTALIDTGRRLLEQATGRRVSAFRAGSFAANRDTYAALSSLGIKVDSSLNEAHSFEDSNVPIALPWRSQQVIYRTSCFPVTVFVDGFGRLRPAQVGACSFAEIRDALDDAAASGCRHFVIVSHNFEMMKLGRTDPDGFVVSRFENLCAYLAAAPERFRVGPLPVSDDPIAGEGLPDGRRPRASGLATLKRYAQQAIRRLS